MVDYTSYSPLRARNLWFWTNAICAGWSLLLVIELICARGPLKRLEGTRAYLTYNFGTTLVWVVEIGLTVFDMQQSNLQRELYEIIYLQTTKDIELLVELGAALYFLAVSTELFWHWHKAGMNAGGNLFDAFINFAAYTYQMMKLRHPTIQLHSYSDIDEQSNIEAQISDASSSVACVI